MFVLLKFFYNQCKAPLFWGENLSRVQNMKKYKNIKCVFEATILLSKLSPFCFPEILLYYK
jgi:hypothetical protein